jgi:tetratricopeptide (TPR) repeat protein
MSTHQRFRRTRWLELLAGASMSSALLLGAAPVFADDSVAIKTLTEQARFWEGKGRSDLAAAAWKRLLQIDPKNPDALAGIAQFEIDSNHLDAAKAITEELKKQPQANRETIKRLEGASVLRSVNTQALVQARAAAKAGRADEAVGLYRQLLEGRPMTGPLALEYYQTLGGTSTGWEEARKGLEKLLAADPENTSVALAHAQHLTYRAATRREGIRLLAELSRKSPADRAPLESWRKALIWLEASKSDSSLFESYLKVQPGDVAIKARIASLHESSAPKPLDARSLALRDGFNALNVGDVGDAEKRFEGLLASGPKNADALGGLGVVRLKQERFAEADKLLSEALRVSVNRKWEEALNTARFWQSLDDADAAAAAGDIANARKLYQHAARLDPKNARPPAALADLLVEEGRLVDAEQAYRAVLSAHPKSVDVLRGLAGVLVRQGKVNEALALAEGLNDADREDLGYGSLKAEQYRLQAVQMVAQGNAVGAMQQLEEALLWDPNSPWLRLELARLYHRSGAVSEAFGLMDGLLQTRPDMPDALHAAALMSAEAKEWTLGLSMLEKIPPKSRTREMIELQRTLWVRAEIDKAQVLAKMGQTAQAMQTLEQAQSAAGRDADLLAGIAKVMIDLGDEPRSLVMMRTLLAQTPKPDIGLLVQYAGLLLRSRQDVELAAQLRQLYAASLTTEQRKDVDAIRWAYSIRQTDAQREAGNFSAAYEIAAQLLSEKPNDVSAEQALARVYSSAGEHARALAWYHQVLQQTEPDVPTLVAAGGAALAAGELSYAQSALDAAARMAPSDPSVLSSQGRLARAMGKNKLAVDLLQQAQQVSYAQAQVARTGSLGVNLVDYTMPAQAPVAGRPLAPNAIPPIPNPLGGRLVSPSMVPTARPLMQPPGYSPAGTPLYSPTSAVPSGRISDGSERKSAEDRAMAYTDLPPSVGGGNMRPVQYVPPRSGYQSAYSDSGGYAPQNAAPMVAQQPTSVFAPSNYAVPAGPYLTQVSNPLPQAAVSSMAAPLMPPGYPVVYGTASQDYPQAYMAPVQPAQVQTPSVQYVQSGGMTQADAGRSSWDQPAAPASSMRRLSGPGSLQREIDELRADRAASISAGGIWQGRNGDAGTSELSNFSTVIEGRFPVTEGGHMVLRLEPVFLSAGKINPTDYNASQQFGSNALANVGGSAGTTREQQDSGMAISVGFETAHLKLDIGTTPLGFAVQNVVGGLSYNDNFGDVKLKLDLNRRPVTDSLLSYAGTVDDVTGKTWGGVVSTGGRVEVGVEQGKFGLYGYGSLAALTGKNVVSNSKFELGAGVYYKLVQDSDMDLTAGLSVTTLGYKRNLRYFTLGHGGYFSPQRYFSIDLPVEWAGRSGKLAYKLDGSIGIQTFRENSAAYYPGDPTQQANWETVATANAIAAPVGVSWLTYYPAQSKTGLGFKLGGEAEYRFAPRWSVGGKIAMDNASSYTQTSGLLYFRYYFDSINTPPVFPPRTLKVGQGS